MGLIDALKAIRPSAEWAITNEDYDTLIWLDKVQTKPTLQELQDRIAQG